MTDNVTAYPLSWPIGRPRTPKTQRKPARFRTWEGRRDRASAAMRLTDARERLAEALDRIGARQAVLSTNLELRRDGQPRAGQREPEDTGVAVYFRLRGKPIVLACDRWDTIAGNVAAIAAHIEALHGQKRWGVGTVEQAFAGFQAIRGPGPKPWREVLGFRADQPVTREQIEAKRRELAKRHHPDAGGSDAVMAEINAAAEVALEETSPRV